MTDVVERRGGHIARLDQLDHVPAELRVHRRLGELARLQRQHRIREALVHPVRGEPPQVAAVFLGRIHGLAARHLIELVALLKAVDDLLREHVGCHENVLRVVLRLRQVRDFGLVLGPDLLVRRLAVLQIVRGDSLLEHVQPGQVEQRGGVLALVQAVFGGLLRNDFGAHQVVEKLRALLIRQIAGRLARRVLGVEVEQVAGDRRAVHGGDRFGSLAIALSRPATSLGLTCGQPEEAGEEEGARIFHADFSVGYV